MSLGYVQVILNEIKVINSILETQIEQIKELTQMVATQTRVLEEMTKTVNSTRVEAQEQNVTMTTTTCGSTKENKTARRQQTSESLNDVRQKEDGSPFTYYTHVIGYTNSTQMPDGDIGSK
ncbi:hypothetical protein S245_030225 [Arachis hypogaea]